MWKAALSLQGTIIRPWTIIPKNMLRVEHIVAFQFIYCMHMQLKKDNKMVNSVVSTALSAIAILAISSNNSHVCAFQLSRRSALVSSPSLTTKQTTSTFNVVNINNLHYTTRQSTSSISMSALSRCSIARDDSSKRQRVSSLFQVASTKSRHVLQKIRHSFTILLASLAFFLSSTHVMSTPPAHASSSAAATLSTTTKSLKQRLNIFKTKSADELIDKYVQSKLFADDVYDPVESAYREAYADSLTNKDAVAGAYPTLLAETASTALGTSKSVSSLLSSSSSKSVGTTATGKNDGITAVLIKASDILQSKLKVSASISYYILAATGIVGICVVPTMAGVLYQGIQRASIDKSEMKMYGKISE